MGLLIQVFDPFTKVSDRNSDGMQLAKCIGVVAFLRMSTAYPSAQTQGRYIVPYIFRGRSEELI
jgi:hypothetical protein